ncbi:MAG: imidazole glycerol phosphate synthase subunit HisH [Maricaulaceae bacterium]
MSLVIVDTGCANLASVKFAFERLDIPVFISQDPSEVASADKVLIPGVGAAPYAMQKIKDRGLLETLRSLTQPTLGICLGMQLLFKTLTEGDVETIGLGLIPGRVGVLDTHGAPSPHMGWNILNVTKTVQLLNGINQGDYAYFVHSYAVPLGDYTVASATYGEQFSAIVQHKNVSGCQFHPERSSAVGAKILENFAKGKSS